MPAHPPWLSVLLARHACALAACSSDEARIGVLRAACEECTSRARIDALDPILGGALLMRDEALANIAVGEATRAGRESSEEKAGMPATTETKRQEQEEEKPCPSPSPSSIPLF